MRVKTTDDSIFSFHVFNVKKRISEIEGMILECNDLSKLLDLKHDMVCNMLSLQIWDVKNREQRREVKKLLAKYDEMLKEIVRKECK